MKYVKVELPDDDGEEILEVIRSSGWRYKAGRVEPSWIDGIENWRQDEKFYPLSSKERKAGTGLLAIVFLAWIDVVMILVALTKIGIFQG